MSLLKRLVFVGLSLTFILAASPAESQTDWFYDQVKIFFTPESVDGAAARVIQSTGEFVGLMKTPLLKLARCSEDLNCTWETVEEDLTSPVSLGSVYLFEDETGIFALYEHRDSGEIRLARPEENSWNKSALDLPQPCPELLSAFYQPAGWLGLLCADEEGRFVYQWREGGIWQADDQLGLNTENDNITSQALAIRSDGRPFVIIGRDYSSLLLFHPEEAEGWVGEQINVRDARQARVVVNEADEVFILATTYNAILYLYQIEGLWQEELRGILWHESWLDPQIFSAGLTAEGEVSCLFDWVYLTYKSPDPPSYFGYILSDCADYNYFVWEFFTDVYYNGPAYSGQIAANDNNKALVAGTPDGNEPVAALYFTAVTM